MSPIVVGPPPPPDIPPVITSTQVSSTLIAADSTVVFDASFSDPDPDQRFTALIDWDDGATSLGTVTMTGTGTYSLTAPHVYAQPGVYTITLVVSDGPQAAGATSEYVVVYEPREGFVTGRGWFDSPKGAYASDATLSARANFGFVSKYVRSSLVPSGGTEFNLQVARLNFRSTHHEWLVVAGGKTMYKGSGTINEQGDYNVMVTATDGAARDGSGADCIRVRIWNMYGVLYDSGLGAAVDADPTTGINGSIVIHP